MFNTTNAILHAFRSSACQRRLESFPRESEGPLREAIEGEAYAGETANASHQDTRKGDGPIGPLLFLNFSQLLHVL